ncbi:MAG: LamG-like jellyroll fold domain-containing protein [Akkermansiaceae bacterium]
MKPFDHPEKSYESSYDSPISDAELNELLSAYLEGDLSDTQWTELESQKDDANFQQQWQDGMNTHTSLMVAMEPRQSAEITAFPARLWKSAYGKIALSAAAVVIGFLVIQYANKPHNPENPTPVAVLEDTLHAIILGSESDDSLQLEEGKFLSSETITQHTGWASIQTLRGVTITLQAPFEAKIISTDNIQLLRGGARVHVPGGAEGFQLTTANMEVNDFGTEFALQIDQNGIGRCRVFEGQANVSLLDSSGNSISEKTLVASQSISTNSEHTNLVSIQENDKDYHEFNIPPRANLALKKLYPLAVKDLDPVGYWRFESIKDAMVPNEVEGGIGLRAVGTANITTETSENHSGKLNNYHETEFFALRELDQQKLRDDFTFSLYFQMDWLQNYALISASHYGKTTQGYAFLMQAYADFSRSGLQGTGPHAVLRDPPSWGGGTEVYGNKLLKPLHWHHMAATKKGEKLTIYLDGQKVGSQNVGNAVMDFRSIIVGRMTSNSKLSRTDARGLVGHIDELAIFDRALGADEIKTLASGKQ